LVRNWGEKRARSQRALLAACSLAALIAGASQPAFGQDAPTPETNPNPNPAPRSSDDDDDKGVDRRQIVVIGDRAIIASLQDVPVERTYDEDDVASYGTSTVGEVLDDVRTENGDEQPALLVNGQPVSDSADINDLPVEAIQRIEALPRGAAQRVGGAPGQRAYNVVLKPSLESVTLTAAYEAATEGGWNNVRGEGLATYIHKQDRVNLAVRAADSSNLFESERNYVPRTMAVPYSPTGNIIPTSGTEIDPVLSALAGHPVALAAVPAGNTTPSLADFLPGADTANPSQQSFYRTLRGSSRPYEVTLSGNKTLTPSLSLSFNGRLSWLEGTNFSGLPSGRFFIPSSNLYTPFTTPVYLALNDPSRPLRSSTKTDQRSLSSTLNGNFGDWHGALTGRWDQNVRDYAFEFSGALSGSTGTVATQTNPFDGTLAALIPINSQMSNSRSTVTQFTLDMEGPLGSLWAGPLWLREGLGASWVDYNANDFSGARTFNRHEYVAKGGLTIPITSVSAGFLPRFGDSEVAMDYSRVGLGRFGTLERYSVAFNWQFTSWLRFVASLQRDQRAIPPELLAAPQVISPNVPYFDPLTEDTVDVTIIYGGAGMLKSEDYRTRTLSWTVSPLPKYRLQFNVDYMFTSIRNQIGSLPTPSTAVVLAFPDRFQRDTSGTLVLVDERTVNFARPRDGELRFGLSFTIPLSAAVVIPADRGGGTPRRRIPPLNLQVNASQTFMLRSDTVIRAGLPEVDLLKGGAIGIGGGQQRLTTDVNVALTKGGSGVRMSLRRRGASYLVTGTPSTPDLLTFSPLTTIDARAFADLGQMFPGAGMLKNARVTVAVKNLANQRQTVRDQSLTIPQAYQPVRRDPVGRTIMLELRKTF
jgi:hypothetical protein